MKKLSLFIVILAFIGLNQAIGQWNTSGSNIYNTNTGFVGIGNNSPTTLLYVGKNMTEPTITVRNLGGAGGASFRMWDNASGADWKFKATSTGGFKIRDNANGLDVFTIESSSAANALYIKSGGNIGIGTASPAASAALDINSTSKGLLIPRLTLSQIQSISSPATGLQVFCTTDGKMYIFIAAANQWKEVAYGNGTISPTEGLVAWYPFNGNANDESGNGNNGTVYGAVLTSDRFGVINKAYLFDGLDDYINTNINSGINNQISIGLWVKSANTNDWTGLLTSRGSTNDFTGHTVLPGGNICFYINTYTYVLTTTSDVLDNNWHYIVGTFDGNILSLYIDDTLKGTTYYNGSVSAPYNFKIGMDDISSDRYLNGLLDDIRIYNRALNESEISQFFNEGGWLATPSYNNFDFNIGTNPDPINEKVYIKNEKMYK